MSKLSNKKFVFTTKLNLDDEDWIEVREPTMLEFKKFSNNELENFEAAKKLFPICIIDTSLENDDGEKATGEQIWKQIESSAGLGVSLVKEWIDSIPFRFKEDGKASN